MAVADNNWIPAAIFGGILTLLGAGMMLLHRAGWRRLATDDSLDHFERQHLANRFQRRMQTSALVVLVGMLIASGDALIWQSGPLVSTFYWLFVIFLVCWISALALGDITSIKTHSRAAGARYDSMRRELEDELAQHRARNNGRPFDTSRDTE